MGTGACGNIASVHDQALLTVYDNQVKMAALGAWLDSESAYRLMKEKVTEAKQGAKFARDQVHSPTRVSHAALCAPREVLWYHRWRQVKESAACQKYVTC